MAFISWFLLTICIICKFTSVYGQIIPGCQRISGESCACKFDDGGIIQLKYLGQYMNGYMTVSDSSGKSSDTYYFNPCSPFSVKGTGTGTGNPCENVVACQDHDKLVYDIGYLSPSSPRFSTAQNGDTTVTYQDKTGYERSSVVTCICDESYTGKPELTSQGELYSTFSFKMKHACCCKDGCKDGMPGGGGSMSGGSILLILCFVLAIVYLILGGLFMKFKKGAIGSEIIPNKSFWSEIPSLVKDGALFVLSPCTKRSSYNQV